jgi:SAM-dependent methyltransferase
MGAGHSRGQHPDRITTAVSGMLRSTGKRGASLTSEGRTRLPKKGRGGRPPTPDRIVDLAYAFWQSKALLSAVELGVFTSLAEGPLDLETLTARTGLHPRGARDFFDALAALGLLRRDAQGRYGNQPDTDQFLDRRKPTYVGALLEHLNTRHFRNWSLLTQALQTGAPQSGALADGSYPALYSDTPMRDVFLNGMTAGSLLAANALATTFPWDRYKNFVDIGTAQGCVPVVIATAHPHLTGSGFDLPAVEEAFANYVGQHGLSDRLKFHPGDFFSDPLPQADVIVMGRILHNWDHATRLLLLRKAHEALPPGGALIVYDPLIDDGRTMPHGLLSSLNMLIETKSGAEYSGAECAGWMMQAGFRDIRTEPLCGVHAAVIGTRA